VPTTLDLFPLQRVVLAPRPSEGELVVRATWRERPVVALDGDVPYVIVPAELDPQTDRDGRRPVPAPQLKELRRLSSAGVRFDRIAVVHELNPSGAVVELLPVLRDSPITCSGEVARALVGPAPEHPGTVRLAKAFDRVAGGASRLRPALRAGSAALLDPLVFGVTGMGSAPRDGEPALWYPLVAWRW
jgi:hypothetical protein